MTSYGAAGSAPLGFTFAVEDKATGPLGKIEKAYFSTMEKMERITPKLNKAMDGYGKVVGKVAENLQKTTDRTKSFEEAGEKLLKPKRKPSPDEDPGSKFDKFEEGLKDVGSEATTASDSLFGLNSSFAHLGKLLGAAGIAGIVLAFLALLVKAVTSVIEFRREVAKLNEAFSMTGKDSKEVSSAVFGLSYSFGKTRDEAVALVRELLELGQIPSVAKAAGTSFRELAQITMEFSAATGTSEASAAKLTDQLLRINRVSPTNLRTIGFSIKNIADNSRMTTDELIAMNEAMQPIFANLADQSQDARSAFTKNMLGVAGALSNVGIDAKESAGMFADMLDETSISGINSLSKLSAFTDILPEQLKEMIKSDPASIFDALAKKSEFLRTTDPLNFKQMARELNPLGLGFEDLTKLAVEFGQSGQKSFKQTATDLAALEAKDKSLSDAAKKRQTAIDGVMTRFSAQWDTLMLRIGGPLLDKVITPLLNRLMPRMEQFIDWLSKVNWESIFGGVSTALDTVDNVSNATWSAMYKQVGLVNAVAKGFANIVDATITDGFDGMLRAGKEAFTGLKVAAVDWFDSVIAIFDNLLVGIGGLAGFIADIPGLGDSVANGLASIAKGAEDRIKARKIEAAKPKKDRTAAESYDAAMGKASASTTATTRLKAEAEIPSHLTTSSPSMELLLREANETSKKILAALKGATKGSAAAADKVGTVMSFAGG